MATIKAGTYIFNETLDTNSFPLGEQLYVDFVSDNNTYQYMQFLLSSASDLPQVKYEENVVNNNGVWNNEVYRTVKILEDNDIVDDAVYNFLSANWVKEEPPYKFVRLIREDEVSGGGSLTKLPTPTGLASYGTGSIVKWNAVTGATKYRVFYVDDDGELGGTKSESSAMDSGCYLYMAETTYTSLGSGYPYGIPYAVQAIGDNETYADSDFAFGYAHCFIKGSLITLADGSVKAVEDIDYTDEVLAWNFDKGCFEASKIVWIAKEAKSPRWWKVTLSDGTILGLVGANKKAHRMFNSEEGKFIYPQDFTDTAQTFKVDGSTPTIVSCEQINEEVYYYNFATENCLNQFVNGALCGCRFSNIYPIKDMRFVKDDRPLRSREEFAEIPDKYFYGLRLAEQPDLDGENGGVQYHKTMKEHIIHNYIEHERDYQGEADYKEWAFRRKA